MHDSAVTTIGYECEKGANTRFVIKIVTPLQSGHQICKRQFALEKWAKACERFNDEKILFIAACI
jgi:hypothetical protein